VADFLTFTPRFAFGAQMREQAAPNAVQNERSAGKRPRDDSDNVRQGSLGSQSKQPKFTHNVEVVAARRQAMYDHPEMI